MKRLLLAITSLCSLVILMAPAPALAQTNAKNAVCQGLGQVSTTTNCDTQGTDQNDLTKTIRTGLNILSLVVAVAAVIMIMIGGFKYITSNGDPQRVNSAKDAILYAIVGLVIAAMAQFIVRVVLNRVLR